MPEDSINNPGIVPVLTGLLRSELRAARFTVTRLTRSVAEFRPDEPSTSMTLKETSRNEFDAAALKAYHVGGAWKPDVSRADIRVKPIPGASAARRAEFEGLLHALGILSNGHVATALGPLVPGYRAGVVRPDSPDETIAVAKAGDLWNYLLVGACLGTPRRTAGQVQRWIRGEPLVFETRAILGRLRACEPITLAGGVKAGRLPLATSDLDEGMLPGNSRSDYLGRTMLRIRCTIGPVFSKPRRVTRENAGGARIETWARPGTTEVAWPLPPGGIRQLVRALSLVCDVAVETPVIWPDYGDLAHFGELNETSVSGTGELTPRSAKEAPLTTGRLREAIRLQPSLCNLPEDVEVALSYWLKSKARGVEVADGLIFTRTALEALFLDAGTHGELAYRLATNGAWYTGRNREERRDRFDRIKNVYGAASAAVHGRGAKKGAVTALTDGQALCREAIVKRIRTGHAPIWPDIVFGR